MILSQLVDIRELTKLSPEDLRSLILKLDDQIKTASAGEKILVSIQANVVGVQQDQPAGSDLEIARIPAGEAVTYRPAGKGRSVKRTK